MDPLSFALRAHALYITAVMRSGVREALDTALYHRKPLDPIELANWLEVDLMPMLEGQRLIEIMADEDLVRTASELVLAAMSVLEKASCITSKAAGMGTSMRSRLVAGFQAFVPLRRDPGVEQEIQEAVREVGRELRRFARLTRDRLGVNDPDAVIRLFPDLFAEATASNAQENKTNQGANSAQGQDHGS